MIPGKSVSSDRLEESIDDSLHRDSGSDSEHSVDDEQMEFESVEDSYGEQGPEGEENEMITEMLDYMEPLQETEIE